MEARTQGQMQGPQPGTRMGPSHGGCCGLYLGKPGVSCLRCSLEWGGVWEGKSKAVDTSSWAPTRYQRLLHTSMSPAPWPRLVVAGINPRSQMVLLKLKMVKSLPQRESCVAHG